jgi:hypothetical protein
MYQPLIKKGLSELAANSVIDATTMAALDAAGGVPAGQQGIDILLGMAFGPVVHQIMGLKALQARNPVQKAALTEAIEKTTPQEIDNLVKGRGARAKGKPSTAAPPDTVAVEEARRNLGLTAQPPDEQFDLTRNKAVRAMQAKLEGKPAAAPPTQEQLNKLSVAQVRKMLKAEGKDFDKLETAEKAVLVRQERVRQRQQYTEAQQIAMEKKAPAAPAKGEAMSVEQVNQMLADAKKVQRMIPYP